jgi:hypothetical protein
VFGDQTVEPDETFLVQLSNPSSDAIIVNGTGRGTIVNDDGSKTQLGTAALTPENSVVRAGEPIVLSLDWTHPVGWRRLDSIDLLLVDDQGESLTVRWHEAPNSFSLFNPVADRFVRTAAAGSPEHFETSAATLHLQESTGGGPPGRTVIIDYGLSFKPQAAGRPSVWKRLPSTTPAINRVRVCGNDHGVATLTRRNCFRLPAESEGNSKNQIDARWQPCVPQTEE